MIQSREFSMHKKKNHAKILIPLLDFTLTYFPYNHEWNWVKRNWRPINQNFQFKHQIKKHELNKSIQENQREGDKENANEIT
jgi:hypothetical protein